MFMSREYKHTRRKKDTSYQYSEIMTSKFHQSKLQCTNKIILRSCLKQLANKTQGKFGLQVCDGDHLVGVILDIIPNIWISN